MNATRYQARIRCEACKKETHHLYHSNGSVGGGEWKCSVCEAKNKYSEALSDVADAAARFMQRTKKEQP